MTLAQPTDEPKVSILPEPELNPLLNPLLAAHMGRWAEVYFTNPPEKRAQAVSELVRELANSPAAAPVSSQTSVSRAPERTQEQPRQVENRTSLGEDETLVCGGCGHRNSGAHRFCGMCGLPLAPFPEEEPQDLDADTEPLAAVGWNEPEATSEGPVFDQPDSSTDFTFRGQGDRSQEGPPLSWRDERPAELHMLSQYQPEAASHHYRAYVGAVVAILLALLVYVTWRSNATFWSGGKAPIALPEAVPAPSNDSQAATTPTPEETPGSSNSNSAPPASAAPVPAAQNQGQANENVVNTGRAKARPSQPVVTTPTSSTVSSAGQNSSEELALAERYLNGGPGTARDSQEAAGLLWKAVAKHNLTAALLLSDLYLRGDGVTKNCDQARLLLDAAARKGVPAAAERLRNLPAFGCQ
jgi:hypothetical protein